MDGLRVALRRKCFYSFHYLPDSSRAAQVRNMGRVDGNRPAHDNDWEKVTKGSDPAIQALIAGQLSGRSCTIVLIGAQTAGRKWIDYEIEKSWNEEKGVLGVHIHNLKDLSGQQCAMGANPFSHFTLNNGRVKLSSVVKTYYPRYTDSKQVYKCISDNLARWVEDAVKIRTDYV
jgi:antiphage defense system Thoeris ThsB-like protein